MRVDFYQLSRDPAEAVIPLLAANTLKAGERLLVVSGDEAQRERISRALWANKPESFMAHGAADDRHAARQPILLAATVEAGAVEAANGARYIALADGLWRDEALSGERVFLLFDTATIDAARAVWRSLDGRKDVTRKYWEQVGGKWQQRA